MQRMKRFIRLFFSLLLSSYCMSLYSGQEADQNLTLYCHGLKRKGTDSDFLHGQKAILQPYTHFNFDDSKKCLGHADDIAMVRSQVEHESNKDKNILLYTYSRGAAAALNYLAEDNPTNIKGLVIDAGVHDMVGVFDGWMKTYGCSFLWNRSFAEMLLRVRYPGYPRDSKPPVESIKNIADTSIPVFIVHSQEDEVVTVQAARQNYKAFKQAGFAHVYYHELPTGRHKDNVFGVHSESVLNNLHCFYERHGLAYDPKFAVHGQLESLQPTIEEIDARLKLTHQNYLAVKHKAVTATALASFAFASWMIKRR